MPNMLLGIPRFKLLLTFRVFAILLSMKRLHNDTQKTLLGNSTFDPLGDHNKSQKLSAKFAFSLKRDDFSSQVCCTTLF